MQKLLGIVSKLLTFISTVFCCHYSVDCCQYMSTVSAGLTAGNCQQCVCGFHSGIRPSDVRLTGCLKVEIQRASNAVSNRIRISSNDRTTKSFLLLHHAVSNCRYHLKFQISFTVLVFRHIDKRGRQKEQICCVVQSIFANVSEEPAASTEVQSVGAGHVRRRESSGQQEDDLDPQQC